MRLRAVGPRPRMVVPPATLAGHHSMSKANLVEDALKAGGHLVIDLATGRRHIEFGSPAHAGIDPGGHRGRIRRALPRGGGGGRVLRPVRPPKKLIEAARWWCGAAQGPDELAEDAAALGIELPDELRAPEACMVLPENRDAVRCFLASATQWRVGPSGRLLGLDYAAARSAAEGGGLDWGAAFDGLRVMEAAVLDATGPT